MTEQVTLASLQEQVDALRAILADAPQTAGNLDASAALDALVAENADLKTRVAKLEYRVAILLRSIGEIETAAASASTAAADTVCGVPLHFGAAAWEQ
ncbi:hypothetical protein GGF32_004972 [Allomyces javanicus]|nr:hypothetical protein GGF32_004972 [Allomyces javanicus]